MAGELAAFGVQKLWDLLSHEYELFEGVEDQVNELKIDLNTLKAFLKDADAKNHSSAVVKNFAQVINEIVFDAEDTLETLIQKDELEKHGSIRRFACIIPERRKMALEIGSLCKTISKVIRDMKDFKVPQAIIVNGREQQPLQQKLEYSTIEEDNLVGMDENVKTLLGYLVEKDEVQFVSITGMGGLGKTTLAREAFNHKMVKRKFDRLAWVYVSQVCDLKNVWQEILQTFISRKEQKEIKHMTEATLQRKLFRLLETSNSLIVLDDIWKKTDWDMIKPIFPHKTGSKVVLTSRNERVTGRGETYINFKLKCLSDQDSWTLFQSIAMPNTDESQLTDFDEEMKKMGKQMIEHCLGLPLAIRVLGGFLAEKYTVHDWQQLSENIGSHLVGRTNEDSSKSLNHILSLSFEELSSYLKYCFLYLAHFPEDCGIIVGDLANYWAAEGILTYNNGETIRDVGDRCIEELVRRNMVISERDNTTSRFETCRLHDLMREMCLSKAKEEKFLHIVGISNPTAHSPSLTTSRRFVSQDPTTLDVGRDINYSKVRSLMVIWKKLLCVPFVAENIFLLGLTLVDEKSTYWSVLNLSFTRLQLLRVLHLPGAKFKGNVLPYSIGKLIHLRYLNLEGALVFGLPYSLRNLKLLIYLNLDVDGVSISMYDFLMGMKELRYLALPKFIRWKTKLELSHLVNLETLINFSTENCSLKDLHGMARLRTLTIYLKGDTSLETLSGSVSGLRHLEYLDIRYSGDKGTKGWGKIWDFSSFKQLKVSTNISLLSDELQFPSRLTSLTLVESQLDKDPMLILEKLDHLKDISLMLHSFTGRRMFCSRGGFPQLQKLEIWGLEEWEEWIVEEGSMPLLHTLHIISCRKLKELPDGLRFIASLKYLSMSEMGEEWEKSVTEGGKDYYKIQHISSVEYFN